MTTQTAPSVPVRIRWVRRLRIARPSFVLFSIFWLVVIAILAIAGTALAPHPPNQQDILLGVTGPVSGHPLGTDELGRDILSRVLAGTRPPVAGALGIAAGAMVLSVTFGLLAGYIGGFTESVIMRTVDLMLSMPALLIVIVVVGSFQGGYLIAVILLALLTAPGDTRIIRGVTLEQKPRAYVEAARVLRLSPARIMASHILPNILALVVVNACLDFTVGLVALAGLSFVGLGVSPGTPDWGLMLFENRGLLAVNPWAALAPALMIMFTAAAANIVGDWMYERIEARGRAR